jgi:tetratricopeptide (TPR) repeat protein
MLSSFKLLFWKMQSAVLSQMRIILSLVIFASLSGCATEHTSSAEINYTTNSSSTAGSYLTGRQAHRKNDLIAASIGFRSALKKDPGNTTLIRRSFLLELELGNIEKASKLAQQAIDIDLNSPFMMLVIGLNEAKQNNWDKAEIAFKKLHKSQLNKILKPLVLGWTSVAQGKTNLAYKYFLKVGKSTGFEMLGFLHLGLSYQLVPADQEADKAFQSAIKHTTSPPARLALYVAKHYAETGRLSAAQDLLNEGTYDDLDKTAIIKLLKQSTGKNSTEISIQTPKDGLAEVLFDIATALKDNSGNEAALIFSQLALDIRPNFPAAQLLLGELYNHRSKYTQAISQFKKIRATSIYYSSAQFRIAVSLSNLDKTSKAVKLLKNLAKSRPLDHRPFVQIGDLERSRKNWDKAISAYNIALTLISGSRETDWILFYSRGIAFEQSKNWDLAEIDFLKALQLSPNQPFVMNYLGYAWTEQGINLSKAINLITKAVKLEPRDGYIADSLGWVLYRTKEFEKAVPILERAVQLRPNDATINDHLGDAYWQVGRLVEARFQWQRTTKMKMDPIFLNTVTKKLQYGLKNLSTRLK